MTAPPTDKEPDALWVFDGACILCSAAVRMVLRIDRRGLIRFTSIQSAYGAHLCRAHGVDPESPTTFLFFDHGRPLQSSDAVIALLARMPTPWRWLRVMRAVPRPARDTAYLWLARNHYRLFGRRTTCLIPSLEARARFIDAAPLCE